MNPSLTTTLAAAVMWFLAAVSALCAIPTGDENEHVLCTVHGIAAIFTGSLAWQLTFITV